MNISVQRKVGFSLPGATRFLGTSVFPHDVKGISSLIIDQFPKWYIKWQLSPSAASLLLDQSFPFPSCTMDSDSLYLVQNKTRRLQSVISNWTPALTTYTPRASSNTIVLGPPFKYEPPVPLGEASSTKIIRNEGKQIRSPIIHSTISAHKVLHYHVSQQRKLKISAAIPAIMDITAQVSRLPKSPGLKNKIATLEATKACDFGL